MTVDTKATVIGSIEAGIFAATDYYAHLNADGVNLKSPTFWLGLIIAALAGIRGYYTNKPATP